MSTLLHSRHPMFLWWGAELTQFYNDAYLPSFGVGKHPVAMGQSGRDCWPEIWPIISPQIRDVMERGFPSWNQDQLVPIYRNGQVEDVYWTYGYSPVFGADGSVAGTLVVCTETTQQVLSRRESERARSDAEAARNRLTNLFHNAPAFVCTLRGPEHVFELVNPLYKRLVGADRDMLGLKVRDALPEVVEQGFIELLDGVYSKGEPFVGRETPLRLDRTGTAGLEEVFVTFIYQPRYDENGNVDGIDVFGFEVTDQVRSRTEAEAAGEAYRVLAQALPQQVWTAIPEGALDYLNERALEYFGQTREELLGGGWLTFVHPDDREGCIKTWKHCLASGGEYEVQFRLRRSDGKYRWHLGRASPLRSPTGAILKWVGTNTEVHESKKAQEELMRRAEFEQQLVGIVSHDLRNPLTAMLTGASVLLRREETDERAAKSLSRIISSGERANRMIRDLLDFTQARLGAGIPIRPTLTDLHVVVQQTIEEAKASYPEREILLNQSGDSWGEWDADRVAQLLGNLLNNALHYSPSGTAVLVRQEATEHAVTIEVRNGGEPIPSELLPTIFQPLNRGAKAADLGTRSIGLGLFIVEQIVLAHGGTVAVRSDAVEGTVFTVQLPRRTARPSVRT